MTKQEFLIQLKVGLKGLPKKDLEERLSFYSEMIDDRVEEGKSEEEAVKGIGPVSDIVKQIAAETPLSKLVKERIKPKRSINAWTVVLIVLGFPLWFPLLAAAFVIMLSLYVVVWSLIVSFWAIFISLLATTLGGIVLGFVYFFQGLFVPALAMLGIGLVGAAASYFAFLFCVAASKGVLILTKKALIGIKTSLIKKEKKQ